MHNTVVELVDRAPIIQISLLQSLAYLRPYSQVSGYVLFSLGCALMDHLVGQIPFFSRVTKRTEYLPAVAGLIGEKGECFGFFGSPLLS